MERMDNQYCMPDFELDAEDYFMPSASRAKNSAMVEDEMFEMLWQNDQVVVHKSGKKSHGGGKAALTDAEVEAKTIGEAEEIRSAAEETARQHVFMQEDELASWLHYPLDEPEPVAGPGPGSTFDPSRDMFADYIYPPPSNTAAPSREFRTSAPEIHPQPPPSEGSTKLQNFTHFSRLSRAAPRRIGSEPSISSKAVENESTTTVVVESNHTPKAVTVSTRRNSISHVTTNTSNTSKELRICELRVPSSSGGSSANISDNPVTPPPQAPSSTVEDRKRKGREEGDDNTSMGIDFESSDTMKQAHGSTSAKKSRTAEVHNLSERKRRDRINEKMKALQELIPRCNKSDKASMLDEAIEYLKSLQQQVQMMSMGYTMVPMMYPGIRHYMPAMGMNRPMIPFPHHQPSLAMPNLAAAGQMAPRFPMQAFHAPPVSVPDPSTTQASNPSDSILNSHSENQSQIPYFVDPYLPYLGLYQGQVRVPQYQAPVQPSTEQPSSSTRVDNVENHQAGD